MCGLFAAFSQNKTISLNQPSLIEKINQIMGHRGPDNTGLFLSKDKRVFLAHTRLSIQDLSTKSNQPFSTPDKGKLIYNGEIYNADYLSKKLNIQKLKSDTDLLSRILVSEKKDLLNLVEGMFAFVKYSEKEKKITFGRDYFGEKPLYIYRNSGFTFLFSEIKFLELAIYFSSIELKINTQSLTRFLLYGYRQVYTQDNGITFFSEVRAVTPGSINEFNLFNNEIKVHMINDN